MNSTLSKIPPSSPFPCTLAVVGEAPGTSEIQLQMPFVGAAGQELKKMLREASLHELPTFFTNVFLSQPPNNKVEAFFVPTKLASIESRRLGPVQKGKYLSDDFLPELSRLHAELKACSPSLILALGNTALWALTGKFGITAYRGTELPSPFGLVLPTFHPSAVIRTWQYRPIVVADFLKASRLLSKEPSNDPLPSIKINPTLQEIREFVPLAKSSETMAVDVETKAGQIRTIAFSISTNSAFVVPFWDSDVGNYWPTAREESEAVALVAEILSGPGIKIFHNGAYDISYLWKTWGITFKGTFHDTMLLHHSLFPEMQKSLGFLGSIYLDRPAWKQWRKEHEEKKDA